MFLYCIMADGVGHERPEFVSPSSSQKRLKDERQWKKTVAIEKPNLGKQNTSAFTEKDVSEHPVGQ